MSFTHYGNSHLSEKERNSVFNKFLELQKRAQGIRQRNQFLQDKGNK